jgi:hypothetical protein
MTPWGARSKGVSIVAEQDGFRARARHTRSGCFGAEAGWDVGGDSGWGQSILQWPRSGRIDAACWETCVPVRESGERHCRPAPWSLAGRNRRSCVADSVPGNTGEEGRGIRELPRTEERADPDRPSHVSVANGVKAAGHVREAEDDRRVSIFRWW